MEKVEIKIPNIWSDVPASSVEPLLGAAQALFNKGFMMGYEAHKGEKLKCSFCGKSNDSVEKLIVGAAAHICNECVRMCVEILEEQPLEPDTRGSA